jgi:hypothetical protein
MATIKKPAVRDAWANNASSPTDIVDPGNDFVSSGWLQSSVPPARQFFNWILNYCANGIRYFSRRGIVDYDPAETYLQNDIVRGDDNCLYQSLMNANIGARPSTSPVAWGGVSLHKRTAAELSAGITPANTSYPSSPIADVRRYGVVGDGKTDDTAALQLAFNVTSSLSLSLAIPTGLTVKITGYVQMRTNTALHVFGKLQLTGRRSGLYANGASNIGVFGHRVGQIQDSAVVAAYTWNPGKGNISPSIHIRSCANVVIDGLVISHVSQGIFTSNASQNYVTDAAFTPTQAYSVNIKVQNCSMTYCEWSGCATLSSYDSGYYNNYVYRCGDGGMWMMGAVDAEVIGNHRVSPQTVIADVVTYGQNQAAHPTTWNDVQGIEFENCHNLLIANNVVKYIQGEGIDIKQGCNRVLVQGNRVSNCEQYSIVAREGDAGDVNACFKVSIIGNTVSNHGYQMFNTTPSGGAAAISVSSTFITEIMNNVIYGYQTTPGINCLGPGSYNAGTYGSNPQQAALTVTGNTVDFKSNAHEGDEEVQFTAATMSAIVVKGQYTSVIVSGNHIRADRYYFSDARISTSPAISITYVSANATYYPTSLAVNNNEVSGWGFTGIDVEGLGAMTYSGLACNSNTIGNPGGYGIRLSQTNYATCNSNNITQPNNSRKNYQGIIITGSSGHIITGVVCEGNSATGAWNIGGNAMNYAISVQYAADINLNNNRFAGGTAANLLTGNITGNIFLQGTSGFPRAGSGSPNGSVTSYYIGEDYFDSANLKWWKATTYQSTVWTQLSN